MILQIQVESVSTRKDLVERLGFFIYTHWHVPYTLFYKIFRRWDFLTKKMKTKCIKVGIDYQLVTKNAWHIQRIAIK